MSLTTYTQLRDFLDKYTSADGVIQGDPATIAAEAVEAGHVERDEAFTTQIEPDAESMSDRALALALHAAETREDFDSDEAIAVQNEVIHRLRIPPDETELGLTPLANRIIDGFLRKHVPELMTK